MTDQLLLSRLRQLPAHLRQEVMDYIEYLIGKYPQPAVRRGAYAAYRGALNTGLSQAELDRQLQQLRDEWERPVS